MSKIFGSRLRFSGTILSSLGVVAGATLVSLTACQTRIYNSATKAADSGPEPLTACLGIQGNGTNFSSHIGTLIGLYENNIDPKVIIGGSSGSIVGSIGRALMLNKSITNPENKVLYRTSSGDLIELGYPQKAALVLAAAEEVMNGFLFVPAFDDINNNLMIAKNVWAFLKNLKKANQLPSDPQLKLLNIEPTVGSSVLLTAFFQLTDFSDILQKASAELQKSNPDYLGEFNFRRTAIEQKFVSYVIPDEESRNPDMKWSFAEVFALMSDPTIVVKPFGIDLSAALGSRSAEVRAARLLKVKTLFAEDPLFVDEPTPEQNMGYHSNFYEVPLIASLYFALNLGARGVNEFGVKGLAALVDKKDEKTLTPEERLVKESAAQAFRRALNGKFWVADPKLIQRANAYSLVPDPQNPGREIFFPVPDGMIIHSTFRRGSMHDEKKPKVEWNADLGKGEAFTMRSKFDFQETSGFDELFQGYVVGAPIGAPMNTGSYLDQMRARRNASWQRWNQARTRSMQLDPNAFKSDDTLKETPFLPYDAESLKRADVLCKQGPVSTFGDPKTACDPEAGAQPDPALAFYMKPSRILLFGQGQINADIQGNPGAAPLEGSMASRGLNFGIRVSAAEPGAFRRYGIPVTEADRKLNSSDGTGSDSPLVLNASAKSIKHADHKVMRQIGLVGFGGWSENVPLSSVAHLQECQGAQIFVRSGKETAGNDFQAGGLLAAINGRYDGANKASQKELKEAKALFRQLNATVEFSRVLYSGGAASNGAVWGFSGKRKTWLKNDMNFDKPCELTVPANCPVEDQKILAEKIKRNNNFIVPIPWGDSRFPLAFAGYQKTVQSIRQAASDSSDQVAAGLQSKIGQFNAFGQFVSDPSQNVLTMEDPQKLALFITRVSTGQDVRK